MEAPHQLPIAPDHIGPGCPGIPCCLVEADPVGLRLGGHAGGQGIQGRQGKKLCPKVRVRLLLPLLVAPKINYQGYAALQTGQISRAGRIQMAAAHQQTGPDPQPAPDGQSAQVPGVVQLFKGQGVHIVSSF